jgi:methionyl-tRNA synthetase
MSEINANQKSAGATEADAVPGAAPPAQPDPPMQHATEADAVGVTSYIELDDFATVDLRVGQVLTAERIPKADKLLLLKIDIAEDQPRQILAGIAQYYEPEKLVGRKVVIVANLKPRKLRGYESQGMVVAASYGEEGRPVIATFTEDVPNGARLK